MEKIEAKKWYKVEFDIYFENEISVDNLYKEIKKWLPECYIDNLNLKEAKK